MPAVFPYLSSGVDGPVSACEGVDLNQNKQTNKPTKSLLSKAQPFSFMQPCRLNCINNTMSK